MTSWPCSEHPIYRTRTRASVQAERSWTAVRRAQAPIRISFCRIRKKPILSIAVVVWINFKQHYIRGQNGESNSHDESRCSFAKIIQSADDNVCIITVQGYAVAFIIIKLKVCVSYDAHFLWLFIRTFFSLNMMSSPNNSRPDTGMRLLILVYKLQRKSILNC